MVFVITFVTAPVFAQDTGNHGKIETTLHAEQAAGYAITLGIGGSSIDLDYDGRAERGSGALLRIDKFEASTNYALQLSQLSGKLLFTGLLDDLFNCIFSSDGSCDDEPKNATTLSEISFLYGLRKPATTYSVGLSYVKSGNTIEKQADYETIGLVGNIRTELFWIVDGIAHVDLNSEDSFIALYIGYRFD
jgi:hypothetical protein